MPDLLTHTLLNAALPAGTLRPSRLVCFVVGGVIPDLASRVPALALSRGLQPLLKGRGPDIDWLILGTDFLHIPIGIVLLALLVGAGLPKFLLSGLGRWEIVGLLTAGASLHLLLDSMQHHLRSTYLYLFPFSMQPCELGWFGAEASLTWWPWLVPVTAASLALCWWRWRGVSDEARPGA